MRLRIELAALAICVSCQAADKTGWEQILASVNLAGDERIHIARAGEPAAGDWNAKVDHGSVLILEGESPLAVSLGFHPTRRTITMSSMRDVHAPKVRIVLEKSVELSRWDVPARATVFTTERWTGAPMVAGYRSGKGAVLWSALSPGRMGYERFPYLIHALADLGVDPLFRSNRLWAFFDSSYRSRVDVDYVARRWRESGIGALHVAAWHFYDPDPEGDAYLRRLIEACHREGVLVYAWLELPHVSEKFWNDHPEWRERTAVLQDAQLDWRKLMNLMNRDCFRAVQKGISDLLFRFEWDGVNFAELYFESLEGVANPARFTPMNEDVRAQFRSTAGGFDPIELWSTRKDAESVRRFLDFRAGLARRMQEEWLGEAECARASNSDLDVVLTHVDDRLDTGMRDAIGADAARVLPLMAQQPFTFLIEDPATVWNLGPQRYPEIARRYEPLTPQREHLAVDINVVDRYQDVYPTKQQTGIELLELIHMASSAFARVAVYFENSILPADARLLPFASAVPRTVEHSGKGVTIDCPPGLGMKWSGPVTVDGAVWPVKDGATAWLPVGRHVVREGGQDPPLRVLSFNGTLLQARWTGFTLELEYTSESKAIALVSEAPGGMWVDGRDPVALQGNGHLALLLPRGHHRLVLETKRDWSGNGVLQSSAVVP